MYYTAREERLGPEIGKIKTISLSLSLFLTSAF
jgi:hypothetical protein